MTNLNQTLANIIINEVRPRCEKNNVSYKDFKPELFAKIVQLYHNKSITIAQVRRWLDDRIGECELENNLISKGISLSFLRDMDELEISRMGIK